MPDAPDAHPGSVVPDPKPVVERDEGLMQFLYRVPIGLAQTTLDGTVEMMNPKSAQLLMPLSPGGDLDNLFTVLDHVAPQLRTMVAAFAAPSGAICEALRIPVETGPGGLPRVLQIDLSKLDPSRLMAVITDATADAERERHDIARQLRHAARVDTLTRMPNRTALLERVQAAIDREPIDADYEFAVLFINCDRFKQINDTFGHQVGDELLASMAGRLRMALRPTDLVGRTIESDQMVARVGGDEFVVLLEHLRKPGDVCAVADRLLDVLAKPYTIGADRLHCGVSLGIAGRADASGDADRLLQDANIAMDEAKRAGGARYAVFESSMLEHAKRRGGVEVELRRALLEGELFVVYQPVVDMQRARDVAAGVYDCVGYEALVRWRHPTRGIVPPIEFISVAEEVGLIGALGHFVLEAACRQFQAWLVELGARAPQSLAVNLSRAQLAEPGLVASVAAVLTSTGLAAGHLQLEVTESLAAQDAAVQARLHELKALGLTLALDDFGTGYSSLSSLQQLPVDTVKIDQSFVRVCATSMHHRVLIEATVRVARSLGMDTLAEGIENPAQATIIRDLGCDKGQGYLFSEPLAAELVLPWLAERARRNGAVAS